ncbi:MULTISPECIES: penicillin-binding transpeptidase domain-containing protein [unclassified Algoriphagus]|jgi:penicillin-binding protein 2|uniref:peptidoglycan D,D-transpeptidase FtsI family protein n=2 Tax=Algoriphagus TaxID=246875 RepID=UPI000C3B852F|nr:MULTISPECIES: penicillin-binding transpeptidase domain-containing protein [unclassified Algoriphagus]MAL12386.1 peptidoglycan glycosyltransferase [Algoriphagus sp.]HAH37390.1 peptidoglycan glycosyltransferase [Algoriphagus sp.]HAS59292.1 peptidoglycan glycosyltransferase [Algoriphagus sp.]HCH45710.1 peptidoglycan glycosyltransferase [Algoriphagus sp.]
MNDQRPVVILIFIFLVGAVLLTKLFMIQVVDDSFMKKAERNAIQRVVDHPYRGLIYDRNGKLLVYNNPIFDLMVVPKEFQVKDTTRFLELFGITKEHLIESYNAAKKYSWVKPSPMIKQISTTDFAKIQDFLIDYPGLFIMTRSVRSYPEPIAAHALGYIGEISAGQLERDTLKYYSQGDYVGLSGIERYYEKELRGVKGVKYKMVNVRGIDKGPFKDGEYDTASVAGINLTSTIDRELQMYGEMLMQGKTGSVVAIEPKTGEILAMISAPFYDPNQLTGSDFGKTYTRLNRLETKPLFNRPIMAMYPPGSIFKIVQSLIGLQDGILVPETTFACNRSLVACHNHPSPVNLFGAIRNSCNPYYHQAFRKIINREISSNTFKDTEIGLNDWREKVMKFGLGSPLGVDMVGEKGGDVPSSKLYNRVYGEGRWKYSTIYSLSIGQGELQVTPLQMANLAAIFANKGYYYTPHLIKAVDGDPSKIPAQYRYKNEVGVDARHFDLIQNAMAEALYGTANRAVIKDLVIAGKTGTAQNPHGEDHSVFVAFAPKDDPKIAIAVYVENAGWGGRAAASTASLMIEKYIKGEITRPALQEYVLAGNFIY